MNTNNTLFLSFVLLIFAQSANTSELTCPIEEAFNNFGYEVGLSSTSNNIFEDYGDFMSLTYVYMSPDDVDKFHFAVIYESVSSCIKKSRGEHLCVHLKEALNDNPFLKTCNWYFYNDTIMRYE